MQLSLPNPLKPGAKSKMKIIACRRCSNHICLINMFTAYQGVAYVRGLSVCKSTYVHASETYGSAKKQQSCVLLGIYSLSGQTS